MGVNCEQDCPDSWRFIYIIVDCGVYTVNGVASLLGDKMLVKSFAHVWESLEQHVLDSAELDLS